MSGEYISREVVLAHIKETQCQKCSDIGLCGNCAVLTAVRLVESAPAADVVEVRNCRFSLEAARRRESVYKCSACGNYLTVRADTLNGGRADMNYCPFCGGKVMHEGQDGGPDA